MYIEYMFPEIHKPMNHQFDFSIGIFVFCVIKSFTISHKLLNTPQWHVSTTGLPRGHSVAIGDLQSQTLARRIIMRVAQ